MQPQIIAHRGASHYAPENTLAAFRLAKEMGADGIEMDIQQTRDKALVLHHDYFVDLHTQVKGAIYDMLEGELRKLDFGSWMGMDFSGERIPTLAEGIEAGKQFDVMLLELKATIDNDPAYVERVAQVIADSGAQDQIVVISFQHGLLRQMKEVLPGVRVGALTSGSLASYFAPPPSFWEKLGLTNGGGELLEQLNGPQAAGVALDLVEHPEHLPDELGQENCSELVRWLDGQFKALHSMYPGQNLFQIAARLMEQRDPAAYVQNLDFPLDYISCEYHNCFTNPTMIQRLHAQGVKVALWTIDTRESLREVLPFGPDAIATNRPDRVRQWMEELEQEKTKE